MAIVTGSAMGFFKGKLGNAVSYQLNGKNVVRSFPRKSAKNKRGSAAQKIGRSKFIKTQDFLRPILYFIRVGFNIEARVKQMSAHNVAKSYNMRNAFNEDGEIDYSKILVSYGNLPGAVDVVMEKDDVGLHFSWTNNSNEMYAHSQDQVMLLAYDGQTDKMDARAYFILSGARRRAGIETLKISSGSKGHTLQVYIAFISDDRERISMSTYVGEIVY